MGGRIRSLLAAGVVALVGGLFTLELIAQIAQTRTISLRNIHTDDVVTVVIPEFVVEHWWDQALHNQSALMIKTKLRQRPNTAILSVPIQVGDLDELGPAMAQFHDRGARPSEVQHLILCLAEHRLGQRGRTGTEVEGAGHERAPDDGAVQYAAAHQPRRARFPMQRTRLNPR